MAKRVKKEYEAEHNNKPEECDRAAQLALEDMDLCQNKIDQLNEKSSRSIITVDQKFCKLKKPLFEKRNRLIRKIPNFWIISFVNHPVVAALLDDEEEDCLTYLSNVEVENFEDTKIGYKMKFHFNPNKYFENEVLTKEYYLGEPVPYSKSTSIRWKQGQNLLLKEINGNNQKQGKKRQLEKKTFFTWFKEDLNPIGDEIAEIIKDDIWRNPLHYYLSPDVEVDVSGVEEEGGDNDASEDEEGDIVFGDLDRPIKVEQESGDEEPEDVKPNLSSSPPLVERPSPSISRDPV